MAGLMIIAFGALVVAAIGARATLGLLLVFGVVAVMVASRAPVFHDDPPLVPPGVQDPASCTSQTRAEVSKVLSEAELRILYEGCPGVPPWH